MSMLLGYYADILFTQHEEAFMQAIKFLFESMSFAQKGHEHVLALQSIDTMNTIVNDVDLTHRLTPMIGYIVEYLV
jgi:hypothetical protein